MAKLPVLIGAVQMPLNGLVFVCEVGDCLPTVYPVHMLHSVEP
jgi:hypothetical protein